MTIKANLFLCAAPRSGSTQLAAWLDSHPEIALSNVKEPNFFSQHEFDPDYVREIHINNTDPEEYFRKKSQKKVNFAVFRTREQYDHLFSSFDERWRMDASTSYLYCPEAPEKIKEYNPDAKIVILIRDPVERTLSHYRLHIRTGRFKRSLREEIDDELNGVTPLGGRLLLRPSLYEEPLKRFHATFAPENIMEIRFEDMIRNRETVLAQICAFLDIDPAGINYNVESQNAGDSPRFPWLTVWLAESGIKTFLRPLLPEATLDFLRKLLFTKQKSSKEQDAEARAMIREALNL